MTKQNKLPLYKSLSTIQTEVSVWTDRNFPDAEYLDAFLGMVEELGELAHALLKQRQGIRGSSEKHEAKAKDAIADFIVYTLHLCHLRGWDADKILNETWEEVKKRDWTKQRKRKGLM